MSGTGDASLPQEFADLEPYAAGWAQASSDARHHQRQTSSMEDIKAFYDAFQPRLEAAFAYLDRFDVHALPAPAQTLLNLSFGYIEAALAVEIFKAPGVPGIPYPQGFFSITRELH